MNKLSFGIGNAKLSQSIATFSLPAGHSCPFAKVCLSKVDKNTGRIKDGKHCQFRCFSASQENTYPPVKKSRWHNFNMLKKHKDNIALMAKDIQDSLPRGFNIVRVHVAGDFYGEKYFLAWLNVALNNPMIIFYGYTKAIPLFIKYKKQIPSNFRFTASKGGTCDNLIGKHHIKYAEVVFSVNEAKEKNLEIDHDDSLAFESNKSFALLLHGTQPPNSLASKAWVTMRKNGMGGYGTSPISRKMDVKKDLIIYININGNKPLVKKTSITHRRMNGDKYKIKTPRSLFQSKYKPLWFMSNR